MTGFIPHFIFNTVKEIDRNNDLDQARWESCSLAVDYVSIWKYYAEVAYDLIFSISALAIIGISVAIVYFLKKRNLPPGFVSNAVAPKESDYQISSITASCSQTQSQNINSNNSNNLEVNPLQLTKGHIGKCRERALEKRRRKDKQTMFQLFLIVCSFLIGYVPLEGNFFFVFE